MRKLSPASRWAIFMSVLLLNLPELLGGLKERDGEGDGQLSQ